MSKVKQVSRLSIVLVAHALDAHGGFVTRTGPLIGVARLARATGVAARELAERLLRTQPSHGPDAAIAHAALAESRGLLGARIVASDLRALRPWMARCAAHRGEIVLPLWACAEASQTHAPTHAPHALSPSIMRAADEAFDRALLADPLVVRLFARGEPLRAAAARALAESAARPGHAGDGPRLAATALLPDAFAEKALVAALFRCARRVAHLAPHRAAPDDGACAALAAELRAVRAVVGHGGGLLRFDGDALRAWLERHAGARWNRPWSVSRLRRAGARLAAGVDDAPRLSLRWRDADAVGEAIARAIGSGLCAGEAARRAEGAALRTLSNLGRAIDRAAARADARDPARLAAIERCATRLAARAA